LAIQGVRHFGRNVGRGVVALERIAEELEAERAEWKGVDLDPLRDRQIVTTGRAPSFEELDRSHRAGPSPPR
jgi:hypothetical protein